MALCFSKVLFKLKLKKKKKKENKAGLEEGQLQRTGSPESSKAGAVALGGGGLPVQPEELDSKPVSWPRFPFW